MTPYPIYPQIHVYSRSRNPLALVSAVRQALRQAGLERAEISRFSRQALGTEDPQVQREICGSWVSIDLPPALPPARETVLG